MNVVSTRFLAASRTCLTEVKTQIFARTARRALAPCVEIMEFWHTRTAREIMPSCRDLQAFLMRGFRHTPKWHV